MLLIVVLVGALLKSILQGVAVVPIYSLAHTLANSLARRRRHRRPLALSAIVKPLVYMRATAHPAALDSALGRLSSRLLPRSHLGARHLTSHLTSHRQAL